MSGYVGVEPIQQANTIITQGTIAFFIPSKSELNGACRTKVAVRYIAGTE